MSVIYLFLFFFLFVLIPYGWLSVKETKSWATFLSTERYVSITDESTMSKLSGNNWDLLCLSVLQLHAVANKGILTSKNFTLTETKHFLNRERAFQFKVRNIISLDQCWLCTLRTNGVSRLTDFECVLIERHNTSTCLCDAEIVGMLMQIKMKVIYIGSQC